MSINEQPKFSIIIPIYNSAKYIDACLESIFAQSYPSYELLLIDDGSTDDSVVRIQRQIRGRSECRLIQNAHGGVCRARNAGLDAATGDYICFVDSDDLVFPDYLSSLAEAARRDAPDVLYFFTKYDVNSLPRKEYGGEPFLQLRPEEVRFLASASICHTPEVDAAGSKYHGISSFSAGGQAYRAALFREYHVRFTPEVLVSEDGLLNLELLSYAKSAVIIRKELYNYRTDNNSATRSYKPTLLESFELRNSHVKRLIHTLYQDDPCFLANYSCGLIYQLRMICEMSIFHPQNRLSGDEKASRFYALIDLPDYAKAVLECGDRYLPKENRIYLQFAKQRDPEAVARFIAQKGRTKHLRNLAKRILRKLHLR